MRDDNSIYPRIESGYAYTDDTNDELVENFNTNKFNQGSAISKINYYNPKSLIVQNLPVKERENTIEINRMRNGYPVATLTSVDLQKNAKLVVK